MNIVEVDHAVTRRSVGFHGQLKFGHESAIRPGKCRNNDRSDHTDDRVPSEYKDRSVTA